MKMLLRAPLLGLILAGGAAQAETPRVVASIAPIHSLAAAVMEGAGEPELLIPATVSEHDYALKPSDVRRIAGADLVIWVGESLEAYLVKPLETEGVADLELIEAPGIDPHLYGAGDEYHHEAHEHGHQMEEHHAHGGHGHGAEHGHQMEERHADGGHGHGADYAAHAAEHHAHIGLDPHIWLDPVRAVAAVVAIADALAELDPENAALYRGNAERSSAGLQALDAEIRARLMPLAGKPFVTFHDGYSYLVERYGMNQVGEFTVRPEQRAGAATMQALRDTMRDEGVLCVFAEPQYDERILRSIAGEMPVKIGVLDALGAGIEPGAALYNTLLRKNAEAMENCLSSTS